MAYKFKISSTTLNLLGRGLYSSHATVISEAISNSWDAEATFVYVEVGENSLTIWDNGAGMNSDDLQDKFLNIGYEKRNEMQKSGVKQRNVLGRKGIGKLAYLSIAKEVIVITRKEGEKPISVVMNNDKIDDAVEQGKEAQECPLRELDDDELKKISKLKEPGTQTVFKYLYSDFERHNIRSILASQFHFSHSLKDDNDEFKIYVKDVKDDEDYSEISIKDLKKIYEKSQFAWFFSQEAKNNFFAELEEAEISPEAYEEPGKIKVPEGASIDHGIINRVIDLQDKDEFKDFESFVNDSQNKNKLDEFKIIDGYIISVMQPSNLVVSDTDKKDRASVLLFATGRARVSELVSKVTQARVPEYYLFGQIHVDCLDSDEKIDRIISSREGIKENDPMYVKFKKLLNSVLKDINKDWCKWRKEWIDIDELDNVESSAELRTKKKVKSLIMQMIKDGEYDMSGPLTEQMREMAEDNLPSYVNCFMAENIMRRYIVDNNISYSHFEYAAKLHTEEQQAKVSLNIKFDIRKCFFGPNHVLINYVNTKDMALIIDRHKRHSNPNKRHSNPIKKDIEHQQLSRNGLMDTALLTMGGKSEGNVGWINIINKISEWLKNKKNN